MISASRAGGKFSPTNCFLISCFQSGILHPRDSADCADKYPPALTLEREFFDLGLSDGSNAAFFDWIFQPSVLGSGLDVRDGRATDTERQYGKRGRVRVE